MTVKKLTKILCLAMAFVSILTLLTVPALAEYGDSWTATPTSSKILVNGKKIAFTAYTINSSNYFKLRDIAMAFRGTEKQFDVAWDGDLNAIDVMTETPYIPQGGELAPPKSTAGVSATTSTSSFLIDGWESVVMAYTIKGNNFFRLRDLASTLNFGLSWDGKTNTVSIDTTVGYDSSDNSTGGGSMAELIGSWSGLFFDGEWGTVYFYWDGTFEQGYGDPSNNDYEWYGSGYYDVGGGVMTYENDSGTATYTYTLSLMDDSVALELSYEGDSITLFKH